MPHRSPSGAGVRLRASRWCAVLALGTVLVGAGCVQRRMTIRSNPPGALVYVDNYEIGTTPVSTNFTYYGTRKIQLVRDGYETLTEYRTIAPPWYQIPPLDFFSENLIPGTLRDRRTLSYQLIPKAVVPTEQLLGRGEQLRSQTRATVTAAGPPAGGPPWTPPLEAPQQSAPASDWPSPDQGHLEPPLQAVPGTPPPPQVHEPPPWQQPSAQPSWQPPAGAQPYAPSGSGAGARAEPAPSWWPAPDGRAPMTPIP